MSQPVSNDVAERHIRRAISRLSWRLRAQSTVRWAGLAGTAAAAAAVIGLGLYQVWLLPPNLLRSVLFGAIGLVGLGILIGLARRFDRVQLAQRLDAANDLKDRLGTALALMEKSPAERNDFEQAQIRDAMQFADRVEHRPAAPWQFPREALYVMLLLAAGWGLTFAQMGPPEQEGRGVRPVYFDGPSDQSFLPPETLPVAVETVDPVEEEIRQFVDERVEENLEDLAALAPEDDPEAREFVSELNKVLEDLALAKKSDQELTQQAADLEAKLDELGGDVDDQKTAEDLAESIDEMAKALEKSAEKARPQSDAGEIVKEALEELAKALTEKRYDDAAKHLDTVIENFGALEKREQKAIANLFEKMADKYESALSKKMNEAREEVSRLQQKEQEEKLSKPERRRLDRKEKELAKLERQYKKSPESQKQLDTLAREMRSLAEKMDEQRTAQQKESRELKKDVRDLERDLKKRDYEAAMKKMEELQKKWNQLSEREREQLAKAFEKLAQKYRSQMTKDFEKLKRERNRLAKKQQEQGGLSKNERRRLDRAQKQLDKLNQKREQAGGQGNKDKKLDDLSRQMKDLANRMRRQDQQQKQQAQQQKKPRGAQRKNRLSKEDAKRLKEMMKRMSKQQRRQRLKRTGQMRLADLKELMRKRRRMMSESRKKLDRLARRGKKGGKRGKSGKKNGDKEPGQDEWRSSDQKAGKKKSPLWAKGNRPTEIRTHGEWAPPGAGAGKSSAEMTSGKHQEIDGKMKESFLPGQKGKGPSEREILYGAAKGGTKVQGYGKVHIDYSMRASRQMSDEEVPPGYQEYVEEYFRLIRER